MKRMKRILVPTDLSEIAKNGLALAVEIAKRINAEIYLISFINHPFGKTFSAMGEIQAKVDTEEERFSLELLYNQMEQLRDLGKFYSREGVTIKTEIVDDKLKNGIDEYLKLNDIDLVVMGTSGEETIKEKFTGNHTEQVISISHCPVISIRDHFNVDNFENIVLAVDIRFHAKVEPGIEVLKDFANNFNATIHLVHVTDAAIRMEKNLEEYFKEVARIHGLQNYKVAILTGSDEVGKVKEYAQRINAGLLAVLKYNDDDNFLGIFRDHFSKEAVKVVPSPVFTYNLHQ